MVAEKADGCTGRLADRVHIHRNQPQVWEFSPVAGENNTYTIAVVNRAAGCLRYLGAAAQCSDKYVRLYADADASGRQRWVLTPVGASAQPPIQPPTSSATLSPPPPVPTPFTEAIASPPPTSSPSLPPPPPPEDEERGTPPASPNGLQTTASTTSTMAATLTWASSGTNTTIECVSTPGGAVVGPEIFQGKTTGPSGFTNLKPSTSYVCTAATSNSFGISPKSKPSNLFTTM